VTHPSADIKALHEGERAANDVHAVNGNPNNPPPLPGGGNTPTTMSVASILAEVISEGGGNKRPWATVSIVDDQGNPVGSAEVTGVFSGDATGPSGSEFTDGNGRTGRLLNILFLVEQELLTLPILYLSKYIIEHKDDYYDKLLRVTTHQSWEQWILQVLSGVEDTAVWTREKIRAIRSLLEHTNQYVRATKPDIHSREFIDVIFTQPYCRIANLVDAVVAKRQTASVYLKQLVEIGVLREMQVGREKLFIHAKLIRVITTSNDFQEYQ